MNTDPLIDYGILIIVVESPVAIDVYNWVFFLDLGEEIGIIALAVCEKSRLPSLTLI